MTAPAEPTGPTQPATGTPAPPPAPAPAPTQPDTGPSDNQGVDYWKSEAEKWKTFSRKHEDQAKANAGAQTQLAAVMAAFGKNPDGTDIADPEAQVAALTDRAEQSEWAAWGASAQLAIVRLAPKLGADPDALIDSNSFIDGLDDMTEDDPTTPEFRAELEERIKAALEKNPSLRAATSTGQGPARMGAEHSGAGGGTRQRVQGLGAAVQAAYRKQ